MATNKKTLLRFGQLSQARAATAVTETDRFVYGLLAILAGGDFLAADCRASESKGMNQTHSTTARRQKVAAASD